MPQQLFEQETKSEGSKEERTFDRWQVALFSYFTECLLVKVA